jgi:hypothetical protein
MCQRDIRIMNEKISSSMTLYYKALFPLLWITGFGFGTIALWLGKFNHPSQPPDDMKLLFLFFWVIGSLFLLRDAVRLKVVSLDKDDLVIKNFVKVIRVPVRNINHISESRLIRPKTITLTVYPPNDFGEKITFIPKAKFQLTFNPFSEHPVVVKLRELMGIQKQ